jgi:hypothetical protein
MGLSALGGNHAGRGIQSTRAFVDRDFLDLVDGADATSTVTEVAIELVLNAIARSHTLLYAGIDEVVEIALATSLSTAAV